MKNNPLFFDSTKFRGDSIIVDIELQGTELTKDEKLTVKVIKADGEEIRLKMTPNGSSKWGTQVRLEYQQRVKLEFEIEDTDGILEKSGLRTAMATYSILQKWERKVHVKGPALIENELGVFEPLQPAQSATADTSRLPMIVPIKALAVVDNKESETN